MAQVGLQRAGIVALVCEGIAAGVAQHVRVNALELGRFPGPRNHLGEAAYLRSRSTSSSPQRVSDIQAAALTLGQKVQIFNISSDRDLEAFYATSMQQRPGALLVSPDTFVQSRRHQLIAWATRQAVPTVYFQREFVEAGGLISYGPIEKDAFRRAGIYAARMLKGEKPANLPVTQPTKFELVINLAAAKALGLDVLTKLLALADEVIE